MRKWTDATTGVLLVLLGLLWAGAKIHFFMRYWHYYEADNLRGYILEHSPFWAGAALVGLGFLVTGAIERRRTS